jgi:RND family efflux transporter MFP subunit
MPVPSAGISRRRFGSPAAALLGLAVLATAGCRPSGPTGPPQMPPAAVGVEVLTPKPVSITSEFVAVVKSRRSSEVRPQVEGIITRIFVKSGDRVADGRPLLQIDPARQQATVQSDQASRAAQEEAVLYAQQQFDRAKQLLGVGAISQQEYEQAETSLRTAKATLAALTAHVRESQVQLKYYTVSAPASGIVGDIPVRVGDRVKTDTPLTTIDQNAGLEVYIQVPIERAADVKKGLKVRLLDPARQVIADTVVDFVSPQVDDRTQSILLKAPLPAGGRFRTEQFVRAEVVWREEPGLTIPAVAVTRINGQYFAFVAEQGEKGFVARQRSVKVGDLVGNDYIVLGGLKAGDRLIVSGVQKIADGAPVQPQQS